MAPPLSDTLWPTDMSGTCTLGFAGTVDSNTSRAGPALPAYRADWLNLSPPIIEYGHRGVPPAVSTVTASENVTVIRMTSSAKKVGTPLSSCGGSFNAMLRTSGPAASTRRAGSAASPACASAAAR